MILRALYGNRDGRWLMLHGASLRHFPQVVGDLVLLGNPVRVVSEIYEELHFYNGAKMAAQKTIAERVGVGQQSVSRYINRSALPRLDADGWSELVKLHFEWCSA